MLFFLSLILYISSLVGFLILLIIQKSHATLFTRSLIFLHVTSLLLLFIYLASGGYRKMLPLLFPLSLLLTVCTGLLVSGHFIGRPGMHPIKIYLVLYPLTLIIFLIKPSVLIHFLVNMEFNTTVEKSFLLKDNLYLEKQNTFSVIDSAGIPYKLVKKNGFFTQTLKRDIYLPENSDSIQLTSPENKETIYFRAYFRNQQKKTDSTEILIPLNSTK